MRPCQAGRASVPSRAPRVAGPGCRAARRAFWLVGALIRLAMLATLVAGAVSVIRGH
jgi:hypothetical protein